MFKRLLVVLLVIVLVSVFAPARPANAGIAYVTESHGVVEWNIVFHLDTWEAIWCDLTFDDWDMPPYNTFDYGFYVGSHTTFIVPPSQISQVGNVRIFGDCNGWPINLNVYPWTAGGWEIAFRTEMINPTVPVPVSTPVVVELSQPHLNDACEGTVFPMQVFTQATVADNALALYSDDAFDGVFVYDVNGTIVAWITRDDLQNLGILDTAPQGNVLLDSNQGVQIWMLSSGEYQINVSPQTSDDTTVDVCRFRIGENGGFTGHDWFAA
jgi:hypothetical protein